MSVAPAVAIAVKQPSTVAEYIKLYFGDQAPLATAICMAESGCRSDAIGYNSDGSVDRGVFQINSVHYKRVNSLDQLLDAETNIKVAAQIYHEQGFKPWVTFKTGKYRQFLNK